MKHPAPLARAHLWVISVLFCLPLCAMAAYSAVHLGDLKVLSGPGEPFRAEIPVLGATARPLLRAAVIQGDGRGLTATEITTENRTLVLLASPEPLSADGLTLRLQVEDGSQVYGTRYRLVPDAKGELSHIYAGQITGGADAGWYGSSDSPQSQARLTVRRGETLSGIARHLGHSIPEPADRIAAALFSANPGAFTDGDPRRIRPGASLRVPSVVDIHLIPIEQADRLRHYLDGRGLNPYTRPTAEPPATEADDSPFIRALRNLTFTDVARGLRQIAPYLAALLAALAVHLLARRLWLRYRTWRRRERGLRQFQQQQSPDLVLVERVRRARIQQLEQRVTESPDDVDLRIRLAREYGVAGDHGAFGRLAVWIRERATPAQRQRLERIAAGVATKTSLRP